MTRPSGVPRCTGPRNFTKSPTFTDYLKTFFDKASLIIVQWFQMIVIYPSNPRAGTVHGYYQANIRFADGAVHAVARGEIVPNQITDLH